MKFGQFAATTKFEGKLSKWIIYYWKFDGDELYSVKY